MKNRFVVKLCPFALPAASRFGWMWEGAWRCDIRDAFYSGGTVADSKTVMTGRAMADSLPHAVTPAFSIISVPLFIANLFVK